MLFLNLLERLLQILSGFFQRALRVVIGLQRLAILIGRSLALPGDIEDLAKLDVSPHFSPSRIAIPV